MPIIPNFPRRVFACFHHARTLKVDPSKEFLESIIDLIAHEAKGGATCVAES